MTENGTETSTPMRAQSESMCAVPLRREDPFRFDALMSYAAAEARRSHPGKAARYARDHHVSRSRACRHLNGDPHAPATKHLVYVEELRDKWPHVTEVLATALRSLAHEPIERLCTRLEVLLDLEHTREANENRTAHKAAANATADQHEEAAAAAIEEIEVQFEIVAIRREVAHRMRRQFTEQHS